MSKYILALIVVGLLSSVVACAGASESSSVGENRGMSVSEKAALQGLDGNPGAGFGGGK